MMMVIKMKCHRCHNENINRMYKLNGEFYCRDCIKFNKVIIDKQRDTKQVKYNHKRISYHLDFTLSKRQKEISLKLKENYKNNLNSLVLAVCGSGKTEIVYEVISYALNKGDRVCFAIPRKEIVKELYERIKASFHNVEIGICVGGYKENENAQFIICTMHQLYRFENYIGFDLMIADEVDAFPFYNNRILNEIFKRCTLKNYIKLSATFLEEDIGDEELLIMNRRYHGDHLPVPKLILIPSLCQKYVLLYLIKKTNKSFLLFVPSKTLASTMSQYLNKHSIKSDYIHSTKENINECIDKLKNKVIDVLVTTTLLERGMTIKDIQVIVYKCQDHVFNERTLVQIAGRVGRKIGYTQGYVYFLSDRRTKAISKCIKSIKGYNSMNA